MDKREYMIVIGTRSYWITEEERDKFLSKRGMQGIDHVALRDGKLILPVTCQEIVHISVVRESQEIDKAISEFGLESDTRDKEYAG